MLSYWLYVSEALSPARSVEDVLLYFQSCNRNPVRGITGYLHRSSTHYAEYVEGPVDMVALLETRIREDDRHTAIRTLGSGPVEWRRFSGWDMGFSYHEITAFEDYQHLRGRAESLSSVSAEELLEFMLAAAAWGAEAPPAAVRAERVDPGRRYERDRAELQARRDRLGRREPDPREGTPITATETAGED